MFRWMVSRPALFFAGITAGVFGSHHFAASSKTSKTEQVVAKTTEKVAPKEAATLIKFEPLPEIPEANDSLERLPIPRISGVTNVQQSAERNAGNASPPETIKTPVATFPGVGRANSDVPANSIAARRLTRNIQTALVRAGCRSVPVSGRWDSRTVRASAKFLSNRNALLPSDRPDVVLLSMLRGYQGSDCGLVERSHVVAPPGGASKPVIIRSASLPAAAYAAGTYAAAAQATTSNEATTLQPVGGAPVRSGIRKKSKQSSRQRPVRRKKRQSWRQKVHYGNGLDG